MPRNKEISLSSINKKLDLILELIGDPALKEEFRVARAKAKAEKIRNKAMAIVKGQKKPKLTELERREMEFAAEPVGPIPQMP